MHFLQAINSDISVLIVCNKTGGTIKGDIKKILRLINYFRLVLKQFNPLSPVLAPLTAGQYLKRYTSYKH